MNANTPREVEAIAEQFSIHHTTAIKSLDSQFNSFGDALYSWTNSDGFESRQEKGVDNKMVKAFCNALGVPYIFGRTNELLNSEQYFENDAWFFKYVEEKGYMRMGNGVFILLDDGNRPIAFMDFGTSHTSNISIVFSGMETMMKEFIEIMEANIKIDANTEKKTTFAEVVLVPSMMGGTNLSCISGKIDNKRIAKLEYYPYLNGGVEALIREFVESDESVLILMGPPGTGKSSAIAAAADALHLLPIYAKKADVVANKDFISFVFKASDEYMSRVAGTSGKARSDLFTETLATDKEFGHYKLKSTKQKEDDDKEVPRVPIIVVEDAHALLAPRSQGNPFMAELLNETDGIGSNHTRKIIFTTNLVHLADIDEALMRPGRCYDVVNCRLLTAAEAIAARAANGLPEFETPPTKDTSLAEALRKPRKRICISNGKAGLGFRDN